MLSYTTLIVRSLINTPINGKPHYTPGNTRGIPRGLKIINSNFPGVGLCLRSNLLVQLLLYNRGTHGFDSESKIGIRWFTDIVESPNPRASSHIKSTYVVSLRIACAGGG